MNDDRPDPRLQAALRNAPDADLQAPPALSARIRAAARDAVAAERRPWWRRLLPGTPMQLGASGAFASLAIAGVIGVLWQGEPPTAVQPAPAAASATPAAQGETAAAPLVMADRVRREEANRAAERLAKKVLPPPAQRATSGTAPAADNAVVVAAAPPAEPAAAPVAPAAPAPAPPEAAVAATATPAREAVADAASPNVVAKTAAAPRAAAAPAPMLHSLNPGAARAAAPAGAVAPAWRIDTETLPAAEAAWLRELVRTVGSRWRVLRQAAFADGGRGTDFGRAPNRVRISFGDGQVQWCEGEAGDRCRAATLTAEELDRLQESLPR